jgi:hypothetical protein
MVITKLEKFSKKCVKTNGENWVRHQYSFISFSTNVPKLKPMKINDITVATKPIHG